MTSPFYVYSPSTFQEFKKMDAGVFSLLCTRFSIFQPLVLWSRSFPRTRGKPCDEQGWKRILKETAGYAFSYFDDVLEGTCATSDGPGFDSDRERRVFPWEDIEARDEFEECWWRASFSGIFFFFDLDIIETNQAYGQCFLFSLFRHSVV